MEENNAPQRKRSWFGMFNAALIAFTKSTKILAALKILKFGKPLLTIGSMLVSALLYGLWLGPWFGVGLVAMLFVHEMGHVIALRLKGFQISGPVFIPFLGAAIFVPPFKDRDTEAFVGYGGPLLGTIGALACLGLWFATGKNSDLLFVLSYIGIFLNIFNLIPISPLDGGRITQAVGAWFKYLGFALLLAYTLAAAEPALLLIWILVLDGFERMQLWLRPAFAAILSFAMIVLMGLGYSHQPAWMNTLDIVLSYFFIFVYLINDKQRSSNPELVDVDDRSALSTMGRWKWFFLYAALLIVTVSAIVVQTDHQTQRGGFQKPPAQIG